MKVVLVHGFTQTVRSWDGVVKALGARGDHHEVVRMDLPGHGLATDLRLTFVETAAYLADAGGPATYVGYSMGGRLCLRMALDRPDAVDALVLVGASPGIADAAEREERRRADARLAADIEAGGVEDFLDRWLAQPLFETTTPPAEDLAARRKGCPGGLAYALRTLGTGIQEPLWDRLGELRMPVVLVVGEHDAKFRAIAERMAAAIGENARVVVVEGAGHAVPLDRPDEMARLIDHAAATR